ncbi:MAG: methionyl-tRNA formyltransferase [Sphingomonadales bacterium]|nr:MAG: methionyl-tRNA formyltransferase [Sphingomonadales bacterium]
MRIIFMGTPEFAVPALRALHAAGHDVVCVYTQPPRPAGRGKKLSPSPVQIEAERLGLPVRSPVSLRNGEAQAEFAALQADVAVVAAYGLILPQAVLDAPKHGCLNIHASLLPRWRGAAPIHRAVMAGDAETGVTIMQMEAGLDTGPMLHKVVVEIEHQTTGELTTRLADLGASAMVSVLSNLGAFPPVPQDESKACYAPKIDKAEARLDWNESASDLKLKVQGLAPYPGAWFEFNAQRIRVLDCVDCLPYGLPQSAKPGTVFRLHDGIPAIACGSEYLLPMIVQRAGKAEMPVMQMLRGLDIPQGTVLT